MIVLKFFWTNKKIAFALDYMVEERFTPLTPFYFFPKENGWEKIKQYLVVNKNWINKNSSESVLNKLTEVIDYWRVNKTSNKLVINNYLSNFEDCFLVGCNLE